MRRKELEIILSKLKDFKDKMPSLEQYTTQPSIASELLWHAYLNDDIENKVVLDAGCGNGILGIGALLLGAKEVIFLDKHRSALNAVKDNCDALNLSNYKLLNLDLFDYNGVQDTIVSNPPFGVQTKELDKRFLKKLSVLESNAIYLIYKGNGESIVRSIFNNHAIEIISGRAMIVPKQFTFHKNKRFRTKVILVGVHRSHL